MGPTKVSPAAVARSRQRRVLGEEAITGMDCITAGVDSGGDHGVDVEVGGGATTGELHRLVGGAGVERGAVVGGMDGDGGEAEIGRGATDADGDLAPVGDEQLGETH